MANEVKNNSSQNSQKISEMHCRDICQMSSYLYMELVITDADVALEILTNIYVYIFFLLYT